MFFFLLNLFSPCERKIFAICDELYRKIAPQSDTVNIEYVENMKPIDKFTYIHSFSMDLLQQMDTIPCDILKSSIKSTRVNRKLLIEQSKKSMVKQKRFELLKKQLLNQFTPASRFKRVTVTTKKTAA